MRAATITFFLAIACLQLTTWACLPAHMNGGCKIFRGNCDCGYGCIEEYPFKTRRECYETMMINSANACHRSPCLRGNCIQTTHDPGFSCKCEGTGFYGQLCEKPCPNMFRHGVRFPHECIVI